MKIAMISYNTFVNGVNNGLRSNGENHILLLQNANGDTWGISQSGTEKQWYQETKTTVDPLWEQLQKELPTIDKVVFYVGSYGAERVIELAGEHGLTPDRAIFVLCHCNLHKKLSVIQERGFTASKLIYCECGGHGTMRNIYQEFLNKGTLPS